MINRIGGLGLLALAALGGLVPFPSGLAFGQTETILYSFGGVPGEGANPYGYFLRMAISTGRLMTMLRAAARGVCSKSPPVESIRCSITSAASQATELNRATSAAWPSGAGNCMAQPSLQTGSGLLARCLT